MQFPIQLLIWILAALGCIIPFVELCCAVDASPDLLGWLLTHPQTVDEPNKAVVIQSSFHSSHFSVDTPQPQIICWYNRVLFNRNDAETDWCSTQPSQGRLCRSVSSKKGDRSLITMVKSDRRYVITIAIATISPQESLISLTIIRRLDDD